MVDILAKNLANNFVVDDDDDEITANTTARTNDDLSTDRSHHQLVTTIDYEIDIDLIDKLYILDSNNRKIALKYPNLNKMLSIREMRAKAGDSAADADQLISINGQEQLKQIKPEEFLNDHLKIAFLRLKPSSKSSKTKTTSGSLCESVLGIYPNFAYDSKAKDYKVIIQGFLPKRLNYLSQQLKIGDQLVMINDIRVNADTIEHVLLSLRANQIIKIVATSPLTFINLSTIDMIKQNDEYLNKLLKIKRISKTIANSKSSKVIKGDRVKCENILEQEFNGFVMILSLSKEILRRNTNSSEKNDIIYKFPNSDCKPNMISSLNELLETIRGLLMTLAMVVKDIDKAQLAKW